MKAVFKVGILYLIFGFIWIISTDLFLHHFNSTQANTFFQIGKGLLFVTVSSVLIIFLVKREIKKKNQLIYLFNQSKELYTDLVSNLPDVNIFLVDRDFKHIIAHGEGMAEFGYSSAVIRGKTLDEVDLETRFRQLLRENYSKILNGERVKTEINLVDKWFELNGIPVKRKEDEIIAASVIITNVTEKKQFINNLFGQKTEIESLYEEYISINEELMDNINKLSKANNQLEINEKKYRMFFENINDAAYIHEIEEDHQPGLFIEVNQKLVEQLGFSRDELLQKHPYEIATPESVEKFKNSGYWLQERQHQYIEMEHVNRKGKVIPVEVSLHFFENEGKKMVFGTVRDIRERVKYIRKLKKAKEKAEESDRLKSAFLANISHEIRTPMNGIIGFSELISQLELPKSQRLNYAGLIKRSADQLLKIINDILDISKIETGQAKLFQTDFPLNLLMDHLKKELDHWISQSNKDIKTSLNTAFSDGEDIIFTDKEKLIQVLKNILNNAEKFTKKGSISFGYKKTGDRKRITFFVKDSGIGLSPDKHKIVFERFRQGDDSHTREYGGTGLGLPIAKGLVELLGGDIEIQSVVNEGTEVEFTIPFEFSSKMVSEKTDLKISEDPDLNKKTVLVVEDDNESSLLLSEYVSFCGAEVKKAINGKEAIQMTNEHNFDLIFMDIRLPDMDGLDVTREIRKKNKSVYIIAQTAYSSAEDRQNCLDAGCNDYMPKPIDKNEFNNKVFGYIKALSAQSKT